MKLILVRHGKHESDGEDGKLVSEGEKQSKKLAKKLEKFNIKEIYSSDLKRAKETSNILEKELKIPITITSVLREWSSSIIKQDINKWQKESKENLRRLKKLLDEV